MNITDVTEPATDDPVKRARVALARVIDAREALADAMTRRDTVLVDLHREGLKAGHISDVCTTALETLGIPPERRHNLGASESAVRLAIRLHAHEATSGVLVQPH